MSKISVAILMVGLSACAGGTQGIGELPSAGAPGTAPAPAAAPGDNDDGGDAASSTSAADPADGSAPATPAPGGTPPATVNVTRSDLSRADLSTDPAQAGRCITDAVDPDYAEHAAGIFGVNVPGQPPGHDVVNGTHWFVDPGAITQLRAGWVRVGYVDPDPTAERLDPPYLQAFGELIRRYHAAGIRVMVQINEGLSGPNATYAKQFCVAGQTDLWPRCSCDEACSHTRAWGLDRGAGQLLDGSPLARWAARFTELHDGLGADDLGGLDPDARPDAWELMNEPDAAGKVVHPEVAGAMLAIASLTLHPAGEMLVFGALVNPANGAYIEASARIAEELGADSPPFDVVSVHQYSRVADAATVQSAVDHAWQGKGGDGQPHQWTRGKRIWITEFGFRSSPCPDQGYGCHGQASFDADTAASQKVQADAIATYLERAACLHFARSWQLERVFVFAWSDWSQGSGQRYGVIDTHRDDCGAHQDNRSYGRVKPAFLSYARVSTLAKHHQLSCPAP
jgi:hypothetical protein